MDIIHLLTLPNSIAAIAVVNVWTFMLFGLDKLRAEAGAWRISEGALLAWAYFGGSIGAYAGRAIFRHKTRKQPFCGRLHRIAIVQVLAIGAWVWWTMGR